MKEKMLDYKELWNEAYYFVIEVLSLNERTAAEIANRVSTRQIEMYEVENLEEADSAVVESFLIANNI